MKTIATTKYNHVIASKVRRDALTCAGYQAEDEAAYVAHDYAAEEALEESGNYKSRLYARDRAEQFGRSAPTARAFLCTL